MPIWLEAALIAFMITLAIGASSIVIAVILVDRAIASIAKDVDDLMIDRAKLWDDFEIVARAARHWIPRSRQNEIGPRVGRPYRRGRR